MKFLRSLLTKRGVRTSLSLCFCVLLWQLTYECHLYSDLLFPTPLQVFHFLYQGVADGVLLLAIKITLKRLFIGYSLSLLLGIPLGILCYRFASMRYSLGRLALGFQTLPSICWVPLTLLWFGQTDRAIYFVVIMGSLWSLILSTELSVRQIPPLYIKAAKTMGARGIVLWWTVMLPGALPFIITGMKQSWAFAWRSLMAAEIYISAISGLGLGQLLHYGREMQAMDQVFGVILIIIAIGLMAEKLLFIPLENSLHRRWGIGKNKSSARN